MKIRKHSGIAAVLIILLSCAALAQEEQPAKILPRWKWRKGDTFRYRLSGDVVSPGGTAERSLITSIMAISAKDDRQASFSNTYTEIRQQEKGLWYSATKEELEKHSMSFVMDTAGRVSGENEKLVKQQQEFLLALIPLPPEPVEVGSFWPVELAGAELRGVCEFTGYGKRGDRNCAIFKMELVSKEQVGKLPARELKAAFYFDLEEGCFAHVVRRIETRGEERRDERLTLELISSPKHMSGVGKEQVIIESLRRRLKRRPKDTSVMRELADSYARLGKLQDALGMIDGILQLKPDDAKSLTRKGELLLAAGDAKHALEHFKRVIQQDKKSSQALLGAARAAFSLQKYDDCARYARLSLDEDKKHPYQAYYSLGAALAKMGRRDAAQEALERYIELNPNIDKSQKPVIAFTKDNDVSLIVRRAKPGVDIDKRLRYTPQELAEGRELIKALVKEESVRLRLSPEEIGMLLDYIAECYGKKPPEMIADFLADREKTYEKVKTSIEAKGRLPRAKLGELAAQDKLDPVTMEALLSMLEPREALKRLEALVAARPDIARYHYLLGRYYMTNPAKFGKEALKHFKLAAAFEEKNAVYHYALAYTSLKMGRKAKMLDELATRDVDMSGIEAARVPVAKERLKILTRLKYPERTRKVTAWTLDDQFEARIVKQLLGAVLGMAEAFRRTKAYSAGATVGELAYWMTRELEKNASSALTLVTARSARERAAGVLVELCTDASADPKAPRREKYARELTVWQDRLAEVEKENLTYLRAYIGFLRRSEQAFQVLPYADPSKADRFVDRLLKGEVSVLMEELDRLRKEKGKSETEASGGIKGREPGK